MVAKPGKKSLTQKKLILMRGFAFEKNVPVLTRNGTSGAEIKILRPPTPQSSPQNPQKDTSGTQIGPRKVIFGHFAFF